MKDILQRLTQRQDLTPEQAYDVIRAIHAGEVSDVQIAGFLVSLLMKGPTVTEIAAIARAMRDHCDRIMPRVAGPLIDTCGTGGGLSTFNISTGVAIVAAGAGIAVAKHGSRSISSKSGSADVLEALGVEINLGPREVERLISDVGIGFMYAPLFHPVMHRVLPPEQALGIKTIFYTIIGPLINPAGVKRHILGVYRPELVDVVAQVAARLDYDHTLIVHGLDGLDEISLLGPTRIAEVKGREIRTFEVTPEDFGFPRARLEGHRHRGTRRERTHLARYLPRERSRAPAKCGGIERGGRLGRKRSGEGFARGRALGRAGDRRRQGRTQAGRTDRRVAGAAPGIVTAAAGTHDPTE